MFAGWMDAWEKGPARGWAEFLGVGAEAVEVRLARFHGAVDPPGLGDQIEIFQS